MGEVHISLTSIPPRFDDLSLTLNSLLNQSAKITAVHLFIPREYRRKDFNGASLPKLPKGVELHSIDVDFGPASKILPAIKIITDPNAKIIFVDDDKIYDDDLAQRLVANSEQHPNTAMCEHSVSVKNFAASVYRAENPIKYRLRRIASGGSWKPTKNASSGHLNCFEGYGGVLIQPNFFTDDVFEIPDVLWTVDDVWLSGNVCKNGIEIVRNPDRKADWPKPTKNNEKSTLYDMVYKGYNRGKANLACVEYYQEQHGIWAFEL